MMPQKANKSNKMLNSINASKSRTLKTCPGEAQTKPYNLTNFNVQNKKNSFAVKAIEIQSHLFTLKRKYSYLCLNFAVCQMGTTMINEVSLIMLSANAKRR